MIPSIQLMFKKYKLPNKLVLPQIFLGTFKGIVVESNRIITALKENGLDVLH